jgi:hypothetical protein
LYLSDILIGTGFTSLYCLYSFPPETTWIIGISHLLFLWVPDTTVCTLPEGILLLSRLENNLDSRDARANILTAQFTTKH